MISLTQMLVSMGEYFPESFVVCDLNQEDQPLIYVNSNFEKLTGYDRMEIIGRNCRFLQGPKSNRETVKNIRKEIKNRKSCFFDLLNHKKDGTVFWNRLVLIPFGYNLDELDFCIGIQQNVSDKYGVEEYFLENVVEDEMGKEIINPLMEVFNAHRSLRYSSNAENRKIESEISQKIFELNQYIKSK